MSNFTAIYDACVLYPAPLRDLLMWLAMTDLYRARWTNEIHEEWIRSVLRDRHDLTRQQLERTRDLMNNNVRDCLVTDYGLYLGSVILKDPDDQHVVAAAMKCKADVIVTYNTKDFPLDLLTPLGIEAQHPDEFISYQFGLAPSVVCGAVKKHRASLKKPPKSVDEYLATLTERGLANTVAELSRYAELI